MVEDVDLLLEAYKALVKSVVASNGLRYASHENYQLCEEIRLRLRHHRYGLASTRKVAEEYEKTGRIYVWE